MSAPKTAVITGASSGIGAVYADRFAKRGYDLVLVARRVDRLEDVADQIRKAHGVNVEALQADLEKDNDIAKVERVLSTNPTVRILVNNAGLARLKPLAQSLLQDSLAQIALNMTSLTRLTHAVLPAFVKANDGLIINIASVLGIHALPVSAVYSGTKGFVINFTRGLQEELASTGVRVQLVNPATTATEIWDNSGIPLSALNQEAVMTTENMVDAALSGLDNGEKVTWPSVADATLWDRYDEARSALFAATQTGKPAPRYNIA
ncbi:SDR family NAD(P)-dependent oxidoreductase [Tardiphaga sp. 862_B3_N4_1]|jgi:short-subunit dehydrogenase|uniref:SDR family NAD(P)-dependent oxidoreductase n=1 Tax=Tardiphaga sp. 862_B3_N4_1 TaxID=3240764 RepID=UPI003F256389